MNNELRNLPGRLTEQEIVRRADERSRQAYREEFSRALERGKREMGKILGDDRDPALDLGKFYLRIFVLFLLVVETIALMVMWGTK